MEEALGMPEGSTAEGDRIDDLEGWDSVGALSVIALLDEEYGVSLDAGARCRVATRWASWRG